MSVHHIDYGNKVTLRGTSWGFTPEWRVYRLAKRSGGTRLIYDPLPRTKRELVRISQDLHVRYESECVNTPMDYSVHGFRLGRSPVTNAMMHVGFEISVSFDLKDCFDNLRMPKAHDMKHGRYGIPFTSASDRAICFPDTVARQGLPTSPAICNWLMIDLDISCHQYATETLGGVYTRYADDLTFSFNDWDKAGELAVFITALVDAYRFAELNPRKTHVQRARTGRRIICGVGVGEKTVYPTRKHKRRMRAAIHQGNAAVARGYREWCSMKVPAKFQNKLAKLSLKNTLNLGDLFNG